MRRRRFLATVGASATIGGCVGWPWTADETAFTITVENPITAIAATTAPMYIGGGSDTDPGQITAFDPVSGDIQWRRATTIPGYAMRLGVADGTILVWDTIDLALSGFDGFGDHPWTRHDIESFPPPHTGPTAFLHRDAGIDAISLADAGRIWREPITAPGGTRGTPAPEFVIGDRLIAATWDGYLTAITVSDGTPQWWRQTRNIGPRLNHDDGTVFVGGHFQHAPVRLDRLDPTTGTITSLTSFDNRRVAPIHASDPLIAVTHGPNGTNVYRIDPETGTRHWTATDVEATPASTDATLVAAYHRATSGVQAIDARTGTTRWTVDDLETEGGIDIAVTPRSVVVRDDRTLTAYDRSTGERRRQIQYTHDAVGERLLHTRGDLAYLVVGDTVYAMRA